METRTEKHLRTRLRQYLEISMQDIHLGLGKAECTKSGGTHVGLGRSGLRSLPDGKEW